MDWSGPVWDFYRQMSAVLAANLLTVAFVYSIMNYSRREKEGREREPGSGVYLAGMLTVLGLMAFGLIAWGFLDRFLVGGQGTG